MTGAKEDEPAPGQRTLGSATSRFAVRQAVTFSLPNFLRSAFMLNWIWTFIVGIVIGVIAKWIMPVGHVGWIMTGIIGIVGSFIGGFIARLFSKPADGALVHPAGILLSIVGAVILLFVWRYVGPAIGV
jgi:uncharacterized membrane protein YeaQ/YmgE (transglycosylase-associated protein family)